jgi:NAD(P)-dependent dehydrogenase (short-subunit alcohol dehydrogenase family)
MDPKFEPGMAEQHTNSFEDYPVDMWNDALGVNLTGMFLCCQAAARVMKAQDSGSIVKQTGLLFGNQGRGARADPLYRNLLCRDCDPL